MEGLDQSSQFYATDVVLSVQPSEDQITIALSDSGRSGPLETTEPASLSQSQPGVQEALDVTETE